MVFFGITVPIVLLSCAYILWYIASLDDCSRYIMILLKDNVLRAPRQARFVNRGLSPSFAVSYPSSKKKMLINATGVNDWSQTG